MPTALIASSLFTSLRLRWCCLCLGLLLFFRHAGAGGPGLYKAQNEFFRSFFVYWGPKRGELENSRFSGGYFIAHITHQPDRRALSSGSACREKIGIFIDPRGLILAAAGQLLTNMLPPTKRDASARG